MVFFFLHRMVFGFFFFFQAEDGIRDYKVTGVQTCALPISKADGNAFIQDAIKRGAVAIASEVQAPAKLRSRIAWIRVREARKALASAAANFLGHPANALQLVAVTGTNGKTTTTSVVDAILRASGAKTGLFGTIAYHTPLGDYPAIRS